MPLRTSHGKLRVESPRPRELPDTPTAATTAPDRDPHTGRFVRGNGASRRRALKRVARQLPWLRPEDCAEWVRPYITSTREHAVELLESLKSTGPLASPLAEELATARLVYRALLQLGLAGDLKALEAARAWLREARQHAVAFEALARAARDGAGDDRPSDPHKRVLEAFGEPGRGGAT